MTKRPGLTLIEILTILAVIMVIIALLVPAVQRARENSSRTRSMNNLREIVLATHNYAATNNGFLPGFDPNGRRGPSTFETILPYCDERRDLFVSPSDPTFTPGSVEVAQSSASYAANAQIFVTLSPHLVRTIRDGQSNTILFAEHYSICQGYVSQTPIFFELSSWAEGDHRRATFADSCDCYPLTSGDPPTSSGSCGTSLYGTATFQAAPLITQCDAALAQTPHPSGMLIALADGSVHQLSPSIAPSVYWALVTPAGGEIIGGDW
jgi:type II secretory pathway pseudopilin PulG